MKRLEKLLYKFKVVDNQRAAHKLYDWLIVNDYLSSFLDETGEDISTEDEELVPHIIHFQILEVLPEFQREIGSLLLSNSN